MIAELVGGMVHVGALDVAVTAGTLAVGAVGGVLIGRRARRRGGDDRVRGRVLLALAGEDVSCAAVDAAARIGRADDAIVVPAVLVETPYRLPLDCPQPAAATQALDVLEVVEGRLRRAGVSVDARIVQGRTRRHALRRLVEQERFDRLVVPATDGDEGDGFGADDVAWLLAHVAGEVLVLRPARADRSSATVAHGGPPSRRSERGAAPSEPPAERAAASAGAAPPDPASAAVPAIGGR